MGKKLNTIVLNFYKGEKICHADAVQKRQRKQLRRKQLRKKQSNLMAQLPTFHFDESLWQLASKRDFFFLLQNVILI